MDNGLNNQSFNFNIIEELNSIKKELDSINSFNSQNNLSTNKAKSQIQKYQDDEYILQKYLKKHNGNFLSPEFILIAYSKGFFPMYEEYYNNITWHNPNPRAIIPLENPKTPPRSLRQTIKKFDYTIDFNQNFEAVIRNCAKREETWITEEMINAYINLNKLGYAQSVETYSNGELVGGLYGLTIGGAFFGESMYSQTTSASKFAFFELINKLKEKNFILLDSQYINDFTASLGAIEIPEELFKEKLNKAIKLKRSFR